MSFEHHDGPSELGHLREQFPHALHDAEELVKEYQLVISEQGLRDICEGDETLETLLDQAIDYSCRYAEDVMRMHEFALSGKIGAAEHAEELATIDSARTRLHNTTMDSFNILSRALAKAGRDNSWRGLLPDRAAVGAFAIQLGLQHYLDMEAKGDSHGAR